MRKFSALEEHKTANHFESFQDNYKSHPHMAKETSENGIREEMHPHSTVTAS